MKYFCDANYESVLTFMLDEAFNLEVGKIVYENNKLLVDINTINNATNYPSFILDDIKTTLKTNMGFIYVPNVMIEKFINDFKYSITKMDIEFMNTFNYDHLQVYSALETMNDHFTVTKVKHNYDQTMIVSKNNTKLHLRRKIYYNKGGDRLEKIIGESRFTWVIYSLEQFMIDIANYDHRKIPITSQLVSILYDPCKLINLQNNTILIKNLTFRNFHICNNILNIFTYGELTKNYIEHFTKPENMMTTLVLDYLFILRDQMKYPEFLPSWIGTIQYRILLCEKRKAGFEIIRHLGDRNLYPHTWTYFPINKIENNIYDVSLNDITLYSDHCEKCRTPLYDDIYVVFNNKNVTTGTGYCAICLHSWFDELSGVYSYQGIPLYKSTDIIARVKFTRTITEIINMIQVDNIVKNIYLKMYKNSYVEDFSNASSKAFYLDFNPDLIDADISTNNNRYIGWHGTIDSLILYINNNKKYKNYIKSAQFFSYIHAFL